MLKIVVLAPTPSASTLTTATANEGLRDIPRNAKRRSANKVRILESIECGVDGVDRHVPARAGVNLLSESGSVGGFLELKTRHTEKDELFEIAESRCVAFKPHCGAYFHCQCLDECGRSRVYSP